MQVVNDLVCGDAYIIEGQSNALATDTDEKSPSEANEWIRSYGRPSQNPKDNQGNLWHQGENNQGTDGPTGDYDWKAYQDYFVEMSGAWKQDFPSLQHTYVFQIWPNSCSIAGDTGAGDMIREIQRSLPLLYSHMSVMSTLGIKPPGSCHFPLVGWADFARLIQPLIERDHYGRKFSDSITPPNLRSARFTSVSKEAIALEFDQPIVWTDALNGQFHLDGEKDKVASGTLSGNVIMLKLKRPSGVTKITYLKESEWSQDKLVMGANGIAALSFCDVPISD